MRVSRVVVFRLVIALIGLPMLASVGCKDSCTGQPPPLSQTAHVRFIHAVTDLPAVDFYFDSVRIVAGATFNTFDSATCCYRDCRVTGAGTYSVRLAGTATPVVSAAATLADGEYYTVVVLNSRANPRLLILHDTLGTPTADSARVRVIHAVPDLPMMDVRLGNRVIVKNITFGTSSEYVHIHSLLPSPFGTDTGGFTAYRAGMPSEEIVSLPTGHVIIPGQNVLTLIVLGKASPNGTEPLATLSVFQDNFASVHGQGDVILQADFAAVRLLNACAYGDSIVLDIYNTISSSHAPNWRRDFPGQDRLFGIRPDSISDYLFLGFSGFDKDPQGLYRMPIRVTMTWANNLLSDSLMVDPFIKDHRYTVALVGNTRPYDVVILQDTTSTPPSGKAAIRLMNGVSESGQTVSMAINGGAALCSGIGYRSVTPAFAVAPGTSTVTITPVSGAPFTCTANLAAGETYTVVCAGTNAAGTLRAHVYNK